LVGELDVPSDGGDGKLSYVMEKHYDANYFFANRYGGKRYIDSAGEEKEFGYHDGGLWNFQGILDKLIELLGWPHSILDVGSGCGGWPATCAMNGIEALGLEFSQYAIDHAILGGEKYLVRWDVTEVPWPVDRRYDWVTMIDLLEHIFEEDVEAVIAEAKRVARRWIVAKICTAQRPREVYSAPKLSSYEEVYERAVEDGFEWLIVSGHVTCQFPEYWREKFEDERWRLRDDLAERMRRELSLPEDWRCTIIAENTKWFEEEFG